MLKTMRLAVLLRRGSLGVATGIIAGLLLFLLFAIANRASLGRNLPLAEAHVRQAFATAALQNEDWLVGNTDIGRHQYNDCLILYMAIDQQAPHGMVFRAVGGTVLRHRPVGGHRGVVAPQGVEGSGLHGLSMGTPTR